MSDGKLNILFDASILVDGEIDHSARTGIYFVAHNVLMAFSKRPDLRVFLMASPTRLAGLEHLINHYMSLSTELFIKPGLLSHGAFGILKIIRRLRKKFFNIAIVRKFLFCLELILEVVQEYVYNILYYSPRFSKRLKKINVFFSPMSDAPWYIERSQIKSFIVLYDVIPFKLSEYANQKNNKWTHYFLNSRNYYFAISEHTKKDFCELFPEIDEQRISISYLAADDVYCPIDDITRLSDVKKKYGIPSNKKFIFSLCTLEPRKNLIRAVKTFVMFAKKNIIDDLVFVLGGPSWKSFEERLQRDSETSELYKKYVIQTGYVSDEDLPVLYGGAEWFVYTSQYEGFGLPPLEAMQCGCPVITSNNSSLPEVVGDAGIMIDWDSDEQHVEAYEKYYFNECLKKENIRKGIERAKMFSWKKTASKMIDVMKKISIE